ncbi:MAG: TlpA disulfide reductase family protein [Actinomycetes bacterium]
MKLILALAAILTLTSCSTGGISSNSENAYISGDGSAIVLNESERILAPTLSGETLEGRIFNSEAGKITVVNVWASWCSPCRAEAPTLEEFAIKNPDIQFVGILTRDNLSSAQSFVKRFGLTYPTLIDDAIISSFRGSLPANAIPTTIVIDAKGRVAARISGQVTVSTMREVLEKVSGSAISV